jgi:hypothetical protein
MPPPTETESPFKRDEPVSRSRKWMLLALAGLVICVADRVRDYWRQPRFGLDDLWPALVWLAAYGSLLWYLWRSVVLTGHCRSRRSFDLMASAVRGQRPFWMILTVAAGLGSLYLVVLAMRIQDQTAMVNKWLKENRPAAAGETGNAP